MYIQIVNNPSSVNSARHDLAAVKKRSKMHVVNWQDSLYWQILLNNKQQSKLHVCLYVKSDRLLSSFYPNIIWKSYCWGVINKKGISPKGENYVQKIQKRTFLENWKQSENKLSRILNQPIESVLIMQGP